MKSHYGDQILMLPVTSLAAATTQNYYFPPGDQPNVGTTATVTGKFRELIFKEAQIKGTDTYVHVRAIGYTDSAGQIHWFVGPSNHATNGFPVNGMASVEPIIFDHRIFDCMNLVIQLRNTDAGNAKVVAALLRYWPLR